MVFYSDLGKEINNLLNKDFYHGTVGAVSVETTAKNGMAFSVKSSQGAKDAPLRTAVETKFQDRTTGLKLTQGWANSSNLTTKVEAADVLTRGLRAELQTALVPGAARSAVAHVAFQQPFFTARGTLDVLKGPNFVGDFTLARDGLAGGAQFAYNVSAGALSRYALACAYKNLDYTLGLSVNHEQVTNATFSQIVSPRLEVGARAVLDPNKAAQQQVNIEFAAKYLPDETSQVKAKIQDSGIVALSYKQLLRPGVTLGLGASLDALKMHEPVHKFGWSLAFNL